MIAGGNHTLIKVSPVRTLVTGEPVQPAADQLRCHSEPVLFPGVGISIDFRAIYRHPFVGDGFPVPRNSETRMGRDGKPVPYDAFTVGPTNSSSGYRLKTANRKLEFIEFPEMPWLPLWGSCHGLSRD